MSFSIEFKPFFHRGAEQVGIYFLKNKEIEQAVRRIKGVKWSQTNRCWYVPLTREDCKKAYDILKSLAVINLNELHEYLVKRRTVIAVKKLSGQQPVMKTGALVTFKLSEENLKQLEIMIKTLQLKAYSPNTIRVYKDEMAALMRLLGNFPVYGLNAAQIKSYLLWLLQKRNLSETKVHSSLNAIKFYFEQVLHQPKMFFEIPRPKRPLKLPTVHSQNEIKNILSAKENIKHKTMLMTGYA